MHPQDVSNIIQFVSVLILAWYSYLTYRIVKASKEQTEAIYRPYITITHHLSSDHIISLFVKNTGKTTASNLSLQIDKEIHQLGQSSKDWDISKHYPFSNVLASFPPEFELVFPITGIAGLQSNISNGKLDEVIFTVVAKYTYGQKTIVEKTTVDLRVYVGIFMPDPSIQERLHGIEKAIKELNKIVKTNLAG